MTFSFLIIEISRESDLSSVIDDAHSPLIDTSVLGGEEGNSSVHDETAQLAVL